MATTIRNLPEAFLYERLPAGLVELDERGLIAAVVGGYQDRLTDLRSVSRKMDLLFQTSGLPELGNNVVLVDLQSAQGKIFTRSLDITDSTPAEGKPGLAQWAAVELDLPLDVLGPVRYGLDPLRLIDANTLDYLAATIGAILYTSTATDDSKSHILSTYFPRLKFKGTAESYSTLGRILGFDDIRVTPLWGRVSPRVPSDVGSPSNNPDFAPVPEYHPQQSFDPFYNPHVMDDGPFYAWAGTVHHGTDSTQYYTQAVNGFSPYVNVVVLSVANGTVQHPQDGQYLLGTSGTNSIGGPHKKAYVDPAGAGVRFQAIAEGASFNNLAVQVTTLSVSDTGTLKVIDIFDRLSAIKYRSSYFDIALAADFDRVEEIYGTSSMRRNKDLAADPDVANFGTVAISPYRPWSSGSISTGTLTSDFLVRVGTVPGVVIAARVQSTGTDRQINMDSFLDAGNQVARNLDEVRAATRFPRKTLTGFLIKDNALYAAYDDEDVLFSSGTALTYSGTTALAPLPDYIAAIDVVTGNSIVTAQAEIDPNDGTIFHYKAPGLTGSFDFSNGAYHFTLASAGTGTNVVARWTLTSTEVIREEPTLQEKYDGTVSYQARPEDDVTELDQMADEYPWRRDLVLGGEQVEVDTYLTSVEDVETEVVQTALSVPGHDGAEYNVYGIESPATGIVRFTSSPRDHENYEPGQIAIGFKGTFKDLSTLSATDIAVINTKTDLDTLLNTGAELFHIGLVNGVLVADPVGFNGLHHREMLACWLPFNEHAEDDLLPVDRKSQLAAIAIRGLMPEDRSYSGYGWSTRFRPGTLVSRTAARDAGTGFTLTLWLRPEDSTGVAGQQAILTYGPVSMELDNVASSLYVYLENADGTRYLALTLPVTVNEFNYVALAMTNTELYYGVGTLSTAPTYTLLSTSIRSFAVTDEVMEIVGGPRAFSLRDLRIWEKTKTTVELARIRNHTPVKTATNYRVGIFETLNRHDRYSFRVLDTGFVTPIQPPAWLRTPKLALVRRYDSTGRYTGESRFKEVGLGGGRSLPATYRLGQQFYSLAATGQTVVSTDDGQLPGVNAVWSAQAFSGTYLVLSSGSTATGTVATILTTGTSPWPNTMTETNPAREAAWIRGDDNYVYEVTLLSQGGTVTMQADRIVRERSDDELALNRIFQEVTSTGSVSVFTAQGTIYPNELLVTAGTTFTFGTVAATGHVQVLTNGTTKVQVLHPVSLRYAEQPTGAEVILASPGTILSISTTGSQVYQKSDNGTLTRPPLWMYLNSQVAEDVTNAWDRWTERDNDAAFGNEQEPVVAALDDNGILEFTNTGTLIPGTYRLQVESSNIGLPDEDFDGFVVEIVVDSAILQKRLLAGQSGYNVSGTDEFEFELESGVIGEWLLSFDWSNAFSEPKRGTQRQLAIHSYRLRRMSTELYKVSIGSSGTLPSIVHYPAVASGTATGTVPGGWIASLNSYGTVIQWNHESTVYPQNDTVISTAPLSDIITGSTPIKRSDLLFRSGTNFDVVISDSGTLPFPTFGTLFVGTL